MRRTDAGRRPRCARLGAELTNVSPCRGIAYLTGSRLDIARFIIKIGMLNTQRQAILRAELAHKGLVAIGRLTTQVMIYMQYVQTLARNGSDAAPVHDIQL